MQAKCNKVMSMVWLLDDGGLRSEREKQKKNNN